MYRHVFLYCTEWPTFILLISPLLQKVVHSKRLKKKTQPLLFPLIYQGKSQIYSVPDVPLLRATYGDIYFWREMFPPPQNDACLPFFSWRRCCVVLFTYTHKKTSKKKTADFSLSRNITTTSSTISITIETHTNPEINSPLPPNGCIL